MAGAFKSAVRALFWITLVLLGVVVAIPAAPAPPGQKDGASSLGVPSTCAPPLELYHAAALVRFFLQLGVLSATVLTSGIKATVAGGAYDGLLPKDGGGATTASSSVPLHLRLLFLLAVALAAASAVLAGTACIQVLQMRLGVLFCCFSGAVRATVYVSCATTGAVVLYTLGAIATRGMRSQ